MPPGKSPRKRAKTRIFSKDFNLFFRLVRLPLYSLAARSPSGKATVCKTVITGSNPVRASKLSLSQLGFTKVAITARSSAPGPARNGFEPNKTANPKMTLRVIRFGPPSLFYYKLVFPIQFTKIGIAWGSVLQIVFPTPAPIFGRTLVVDLLAYQILQVGQISNQIKMTDTRITSLYRHF